MTPCRLSAAVPLKGGQRAIFRNGLLSPFDGVIQIYFAAQGVGFQPAASGSFLKSVVVT
jgi:hypothetical protein